MKHVRLSVCIATYRRLDRLDAVLEDLLRQELKPDEVVVVDNDVSGSAQTVIERRRSQDYPIPLVYEIQPERNISKTRNRTVALAQGEWLAFIDDDERAPPFWLRKLLEAAATYGADGVLAPVEPRLPDNAPAWIRRGRFYDWPHLATGNRVPAKMLRFGNVLLRGVRLRAEPGPFDPAFGLATGEDQEMLMRLADKGAQICWCDEAIVDEPIEPRRLSLRWLLQRALSGGQHFARLSLQGRHHSVNLLTRAMLFARWTGQLLVALLLAVACLPAGRHRSAAWLVKAAANVGKLTAIWGWRYGEYA
ncbi:MAG TPA: glycosyltransferase [Steroidobacteraceae bacterium]|nr:glycosyltransferase [Steroidobacteraceae bacterium]